MNTINNAAAVRMTAAANFYELCQLIDYHYSGGAVSNDGANVLLDLISAAIVKVSDAAKEKGINAITISDTADFCGINVRLATRLFRKAAAFEKCGLGDFWQYLLFIGRFRSYRRAFKNGYINKANLKNADYYEKPAVSIPKNHFPILFEFFNKENHIEAVTFSGEKSIYHKNDVFFCPIIGDFCAQSMLSRVFTKDKALFEATIKHGGGADRGGFYQIGVSDLAIQTTRAGVYVDYYHAVIFTDELSEFDVFQLQETGAFVHVSEGYVWSDGLLHARPDGMVCGPNEAVSGYHSNTRLTNAPVRFSRNAPYLVGFEIEKEDERVKCSITAADFSSELPNFRKERDGSLNDRSGFEFITPPLELSPRNIRAYLEARPVAVAHINAAFSTSCGGHIHLSRRGYSGRQLFDMIAGHLPLLHALFPARADGSNSRYCMAKSAADLISDRVKYQSINILNDRIEFRIFGAVRGMDNLIWRAGLVLKLFKHSASTPAQGFEKLPRLFSHLRKVYATPVELEAVIKRVEKYARKFEGYRPDAGIDAAGRVTDAARFKIYRPATARLSSYKSVIS